MNKYRGLAIAGDYYHKAAELRQFIEAASLDNILWDWHSVSNETDFQALMPEDSWNYDIIIIASENRVCPEESDRLWMDEETGRKYSEYIKSGRGFIALHTGMAAYPKDGAYVEMVGGSFEFHPEPHPEFSIIPEKTDHPLMSGIGRFLIRDELYFVERDPESSTLLAVTDSPRYGSSAAFWCRSHGDGRVIGLTPGHTVKTQSNSQLIRMLGNAISWCLGVG